VSLRSPDETPVEIREILEIESEAFQPSRHEGRKIMTSNCHDPIISGIAYHISDVAGRSPSDIADFVVNTEMWVETDGNQHHIFGVGAYSSDGVRFYEKDLQNEGKDVRVWSISPSPDGEGFTAEHIAAI
jgi:hypothetical protein